MPGKILTVAIHKGGAGKTTVAVHLALYAADQGHRVLLVDLDAQGNATRTAYADDVDDQHQRAYELFEDAPSTKPVLRISDNLHLLPAKRSDAELLEVERLPLETAGFFAQRIGEHAANYDLVVVDTPPTMGFAMLAPMLASDLALAPVIPDEYGVDGAIALVERIEQIRSSRNRSLRFLGLLVNKWNRRNVDQTAVVEAFRLHLRAYVIPHVLPDSSLIARLARTREPVWRSARSGSQRRITAAMRAALDWLLKEAFRQTEAPRARAVGGR